METTWVQPMVAGALAMSSGRLGATVAYAAGLTSLALGVLALRSARRLDPVGDDAPAAWWRAPTVPIWLGLFGLALGGLVVAAADGGVGTGDGLGGGVIAVALGVVGVVVGGLARARRREVV